MYHLVELDVLWACQILLTHQYVPTLTSRLYRSATLLTILFLCGKIGVHAKLFTLRQNNPTCDKRRTRAALISGVTSVTANSSGMSNISKYNLPSHNGYQIHMTVHSFCIRETGGRITCLILLSSFYDVNDYCASSVEAHQAVPSKCACRTMRYFCISQTVPDDRLPADDDISILPRCIHRL